MLVGLDDLLSDCGGDNQHLNVDDVHECDYDVVGQSVHGRVRRDRQTSRDKLKCDDVRYQKVRSGNGVRLASGVHV
jgi:hypothetical protein